MDVFFKGLLVGTAAGVGVGFFAGYFIASRYELVSEAEAVAEESKELLAEELDDYIAKGFEKKHEPDVDDFDEFMEKYGAHPEEADSIEPHIITEDQYENEAKHLDKIRLIFYPDYGVLVTEEDELVDSPPRMLGENIVAFMEDTFEDNGPRTVYIRNERFGADYEVELCTKLQADGWIRDYLEGMDA